MASFLEQLEHAEILLQTYRRPDIDEVLVLLDKVLQAAELGSIQYESVVRIQVQQQSVRIDTEWRILRHERSECGERDVNVSTEWARLWRRV